jgi:hypothetical protein
MFKIERIRVFGGSGMKNQVSLQLAFVLHPFRTMKSHHVHESILQ